MEARIIELESRLAYQEKLIQELSDVVAHHQRAIDALRKQHERILVILRGMDASPRPQDEPPPPHY